MLVVGLAILTTNGLPADERNDIPKDPGFNSEILHMEDSPFGLIFVVQHFKTRYMRFDDPRGDNQSAFVPEDPAAVPMNYVRLSTLSLAHRPNPESYLMIGLGGGSISTLLWRSFPALIIDAVEINPVVPRIAREYFGMPDDPRYRIHIDDGARWVENTEQSFDTIFIDAYTGTDIPDHLATVDFFQLVKTRLNKGGVAVLNLAVPLEKETELTGRFNSVFESTWCYRARNQGNLVLIGETEATPDHDLIYERSKAITDELNLPFHLEREARRTVDCHDVLSGNHTR